MEAEALLREYVAFPGADVCGRWSTDYSGLHRRIRTGRHPNPSFITWSYPDTSNPPHLTPPSISTKNVPPPSMWPRNAAQAGLGDHLLGVVSAFLAALITGRAMVLQNEVLESVFEPAEVDWRLRGDVPMHRRYRCWRDECRAVRGVSKGQGDGSVLTVVLKNGRPIVRGSAVKFPSDISTFFSPLSNFSNLRVWTNGGVLSLLRAQKSETRQVLESLGLDLSKAFGCIVRHLLRPKSHILKLAKPYSHFLQHRPLDRSHQRRRMCVHLRSRDGLDDSSAEEQRRAFRWLRKHALHCAQETAETLWKHSPYTLLVTADSQVLMTDFLPHHYSVGGAASTLAEWLLFSSCQAYIIPQSGLSKTASAYNIGSPQVFLIPRMDGREWGISEEHSAECPGKTALLHELHMWNGA